MIFYARETIGRGVPPCRPVHGQDEVLVTVRGGRQDEETFFLLGAGFGDVFGADAGDGGGARCQGRGDRTGGWPS